MGNFYLLDKDGNFIHNLTQWDINQKLIIEIVQNISTAPKVHFCNKNSEKALVVQSTISGNKIIADIPNILLTEPLNMIAYVYYNNDTANDSWKTIQTIDIPLRKRVKPNDYEYVENVEIIYLSDLMQIVKTLDKEIQEAENVRVENENIRINNENARTINESKREENFQKAIQDINTETTNAQNFISDMKKYGAVIVDNVEPESENIDIWINDSNVEEYSLPEIRDDEINTSDTWSSEKINTELQKTFASSIATDEEANEYLGI